MGRREETGRGSEQQGGSRGRDMKFRGEERLIFLEKRKNTQHDPWRHAEGTYNISEHKNTLI